MRPPLRPVAWITGEYPRATDTFIQREVFGLRAAGIAVKTFSIRRTPPAHHVGPEQVAEAAATRHVLERALRPGPALAAHLAALRRPGAWIASLATAWRTAAPGVRGRLYQFVYWHEAVVLAAMLRAEGVAHVHAHIAKAACTVARLAAPLAGMSFSFTLHGPDDLEEPARWRLDDKIAAASFVACISSYARSQAMLRCPPGAWGRLHVVHCGVDPARYGAGEAPRPGALLFIGRLAAVKGLPLLLDALRAALPKDPGLSLTVVGDGPERAAWEAAASGLPVTFLGSLGQAEVATLLASHAALVLPSLAEGVPVVLMEAMAAGRPVVGPRLAGIPELVENGTMGLLVPPGEEGALAEAILAVTADGPRAAAMGAAGRARVAAEFDAGVEARRMAALLAHAQGLGPEPARRPEPWGGTP